MSTRAAASCPLRAAESARDDRWRTLPAVVAGCVWSNLPVLLAMDAVLVVAAVPAVLLALSGGYLLAPLVAAALVGPVWAGTVATTDRIVRGDAPSVRMFVTELRRYARRGLALAVVAAVVATAAVATSATFAANPRERWLLVPYFVDLSVLTLLLVAGLSAFSLATSAGLRGWTLVRASLEVAAAHKLAAAGTVGLVILLGLLVGWLPGVAAVLPAPLAVYLSAWTSAAVRRTDAHLPN